MPISLGQQYTQSDNKIASDFLIKNLGSDDLSKASLPELSRVYDLAKQQKIPGLTGLFYSGGDLQSGYTTALSEYQKKITSGAVADRGRDYFRSSTGIGAIGEAFNSRIKSEKQEMRAGMTALTKDGKIIYYKPDHQDIENLVNNEGWTNQGVTTPAREYDSPALAPEGSDQAGSATTDLQDFTGQTPQQIADQGYQISGTDVYSNGVKIGTTTGTTDTASANGATGGGTTSSTNKIPSGALVRNKSNGKVYFVDENGKFRYVTNPSWIAGKGVIDIDGSHIDEVNMGADLTTQPDFEFMGADEAQALMDETGINWSEPRGYDPATDTSTGGTTDGSTGGTTVGGADGTTGGDTTIEDGATEGETTEGGETNMPQAVIDKFYHAYGKFPSQSDINDYLNNPDAYNNILDQEITAKDETASNEADEATSAESQANLDAAYAIIDQAVADGLISPDIAEMWKQTVAIYPEGVGYNTEEILNAFNEIKEGTIDPYFQELADIAISDLQNSLSEIKAARGLEEENEGIREEQELEQTKSGLESRGLTFGGQAVKELGGESAGGIAGTEGELQERQNLLASSSSARYQSALQGLSREAEGYLGSAGLGIVPGYESTGVNLTGQWQNQRENRYASTLQDIINQYQQGQQLQTNT